MAQSAELEPEPYGSMSSSKLKTSKQQPAAIGWTFACARSFVPPSAIRDDIFLGRLRHSPPRRIRITRKGRRFIRATVFSRTGKCLRLLSAGSNRSGQN
ncbi:Putative 4'-phosphopantetheinyl transferase [Anopheles sinensis]|uniref:Putative 4'-phosphopantetheinyl transferase n=1 Tax=Anopheles sinensis TaxID=74873 RepID=A0A084WKW0_ANOSI|nr:Putative 4'-phosphopantetheinyl transferase [Anopheles sinensis]